MHRAATLRLLVVLVAACLGWAASTTPAGAEGWTWPLSGSHRVLRGLDLPAQPWLPGHRGVDLAGRPGQAVRAAGAGVVRFAGRVAGIGVVSITHSDGLVTTYQPVAATVRAGDAVRPGERIGHLLRTGSHCPTACLHWALRRDAAYLDPLALVGAGRVRLLPLGPTTGLPGAAGSTAAVAGGAGLAVAAVRRRRRSSVRSRRRR